ncbi:TonB family protein [Undibacterium sp. Jales W-56]|uniref:TonB family protein n=1 Tax=Undibacterium sp. Jales W-56 TaxID=2897325 RepID=UPI0021D1F208|nr:TonB family protein [Undibacterium sp. Jales W-56]MCU6435618.1 TonB family protein [Undibacterium sp. Jales W-56]
MTGPLKKLLGIALACVATLAYAQELSITAPSPAATAELPPAHFDNNIAERCPKPDYPKVALQNEFQGDSVISLGIDENGKIERTSVLRSSGWRILDDAVSKTIIGCQLMTEAPLKKLTRSAVYKWRTSGAIEYQPELIPASCAESELVRFADDKEQGRGIVVGAYISDLGMPGRFSLEWGSGQIELDRASVALVKTCKFKAARRDLKKRSAPISLRLFPKTITQ